MTATAELLGRRVAALRDKLPFAFTYAGSSASLFVGSLAQLLAFAVLARFLGPAQFGVLLTITAITNIALNLVGLGANEPMVRRVAVDPQLYPRMLGHNLVLSGTTALVVFPVTAIVVAGYAQASQQEALPVTTALAFAFANTVLLRLVLVAEQAFIARRQFGPSNLINLGLGLARVATAALACLVFKVEDLSAWALWHLAGYAVLAGACLVAIAPLGRPVWTVRTEDLRQGFYFLLAQLGLALRQSVDILVLGLVAPASVVGNFGIARRIASTSYLTVEALHRITYPRLSAAMLPGLNAGRPLALRVAAAALAIALTTAIGVYVLAPLLPAIFGQQYEPAVGFVRALCWIVIPFALWDIGAEALGASAKQGTRASLINASVLGVALIAAMTYLFGTSGTIAAIYIVDGALALAFWWTILHLSRRERSSRPEPCVSRGGAMSLAVDLARERGAATPGAPAKQRVLVADDLGSFADLWPRALQPEGHAVFHVFQSAEFLQVWLDTIGRARGVTPCLCAVLDAGGAPLMLLALGIERRAGARVLTFLDGGASDYNAPVLFDSTPDWTAQEAACVVQQIFEAIPAFDVAVFEKMPAQVLGRPNPLLHIGTEIWPCGGHAATTAKSWGEFAASRIKHSKRFDRYFRKLERAGPASYSVADASASERCLETLFAQKEARFAETRVPGFYESPGAIDFYREMTRRFIGTGFVHLSAVTSGGHTLAAQWGLKQGRRYYYLICGYEAGEWEKYSPGLLVTEAMLKWCHDNQVAIADFGVGDEDYKYNYCDDHLELYGTVRPMTWRGWVYAARARTRAWLRNTRAWQALRPYKWAMLRRFKRRRREA